MITDKKAEELEQRGLWRRAAARWQELLLNYLQEDDRICIQRRIQHCLKRAKNEITESNQPGRVLLQIITQFCNTDGKRNGHIQGPQNST
ncbi:TPA: PerC family transcriptional regulator [Escherichia coli]